MTLTVKGTPAERRGQDIITAAAGRACCVINGENILHLLHWLRKYVATDDYGVVIGRVLYREYPVLVLSQAGIAAWQSRARSGNLVTAREACVPGC